MRMIIYKYVFKCILFSHVYICCQNEIKTFTLCKMFSEYPVLVQYVGIELCNTIESYFLFVMKSN